MHIDELHSLYSSPNIVKVIKSRRMRNVGHGDTHGGGEGTYRVLVGRSECKSQWGENFPCFPVSFCSLK